MTTLAALVLAGVGAGAVRAESEPAVFYRSLDALIGDSDAVVVGTVTVTEPGTPIADGAGRCDSTHAHVRIEESLQGEVAVGSTVTVRFFSYCTPGPAIDDSATSERSLFFLRRSSSAGAFRPTGVESVAIDDDGLVRATDVVGVPVLARWHGEPFDRLLAATRDAAGLPDTSTVRRSNVAWDSTLVALLFIASAAVLMLRVVRRPR